MAIRLTSLFGKNFVRVPEWLAAMGIGEKSAIFGQLFGKAEEEPPVANASAQLDSFDPVEL